MRKGHSKIFQQDVIDVLDKQLLEGMGVLLTEEEQQKCKESVCRALSSCVHDYSIQAFFFPLLITVALNVIGIL